MTVKNVLSSEKGASSVLVIFVMLVLVTFGALAISSANINYKLSRRTLEWNAMYYELDGKGEEFLAELDGKLAQAEQTACDYMLVGGYLMPEHPDIADELQNVIFSEYNLKRLTTNDIINKIYLYYADTFVNELSLDFSNLSVYPLYNSSNSSFIDSIYTDISFVPDDPEQSLCGLKVSVSVLPLDYKVIESGGGLLLTREKGLRYNVVDWYEYQEPLNEEAPEELWDGEMPEEGGGVWDGSL